MCNTIIIAHSRVRSQRQIKLKPYPIPWPLSSLFQGELEYATKKTHSHFTQVHTCTCVKYGKYKHLPNYYYYLLFNPLSPLTVSSKPMYMNCMIHCCTSGLLRSQMFLLDLRREVRNSLALEGVTATPTGFVPPPTKEIQVGEVKGQGADVKQSITTPVCLQKAGEVCREQGTCQWLRDWVVLTDQQQPGQTGEEPKAASATLYKYQRVFLYY